jgi:hypothetical protein
MELKRNRLPGLILDEYDDDDYSGFQPSCHNTYNKIVMVLGEILVTQRTDRSLHGLISHATNFAG